MLILNNARSSVSHLVVQHRRNGDSESQAFNAKTWAKSFVKVS